MCDYLSPTTTTRHHKTRFFDTVSLLIRNFCLKFCLRLRMILRRNRSLLFTSISCVIFWQATSYSPHIFHHDLGHHHHHGLTADIYLKFFVVLFDSSRSRLFNEYKYHFYSTNYIFDCFFLSNVYLFLTFFYCYLFVKCVPN